MVTFNEFIKREFDIEVPKGNISGAWFAEHRIPMVVRCCCCDMTMASPCAHFDKKGYTYCSTCAEE